MTFAVLRCTHQVLCRLSFNLNLSDIFVTDCGYGFEVGCQKFKRVQEESNRESRALCRWRRSFRLFEAVNPFSKAIHIVWRILLKKKSRIVFRKSEGKSPHRAEDSSKNSLQARFAW